MILVDVLLFKDPQLNTDYNWCPLTPKNRVRILSRVVPDTDLAGYPADNFVRYPAKPGIWLNSKYIIFF